MKQLQALWKKTVVSIGNKDQGQDSTSGNSYEFEVNKYVSPHSNEKTGDPHLCTVLHSL